jgi:hypothetical protein
VNSTDPFHIYTLRLLARPASGFFTRPFRRGDVNDSGDPDIGDAVGILVWRFVGGFTPGCLEAADVNGDARHDLGDAIGLLEYLFVGGPPPPSPGARVCGAIADPVFGCERHPACAQ